MLIKGNKRSCQSGFICAHPAWDQTNKHSWVEGLSAPRHHLYPCQAEWSHGCNFLSNGTPGPQLFLDKLPLALLPLAFRRAARSTLLTFMMTDVRPLALQTKSPLKSPLTAVILNGGGETYKEARLSSGEASGGGGTGILKQFVFCFLFFYKNLYLK